MLNNAHLSIGSTAVQSLKCIFACKVDLSDSYLEISVILYHYLLIYIFKPMFQKINSQETEFYQTKIHFASKHKI